MVNTCKVKSHRLSRPNFMGACPPSACSMCQVCLMWRPLSSLLSACGSLPLVFSLAASLFPNHGHNPPTLFDVSSLWLTVESFGPFSGLGHRCGCYLGVPMGRGEPRIFLLCHLPRSPNCGFFLCPISLLSVPQYHHFPVNSQHWEWAFPSLLCLYLSCCSLCGLYLLSRSPPVFLQEELLYK